MTARVLHNYKWDQRVREGVEYLDTFWTLRMMYDRMDELVHEMERTLLAAEMNEFRRCVVDNGKPGKRHMLPFVWVRGEQVPVRVGSMHYENAMRTYAHRMAALKERTPNYGRKI